MSYYAKVILDSMCVDTGKRITTLELRYPRFIHSEILTHRDRARNSASSRAIPFPTMCERVTGDPVVPLQWLSEQKGMQGGDEVPAPLRPLARAIWLRSMESQLRKAEELHLLSRTAHELVRGPIGAHRDPGHYNRLASYSGMLSAEEHAMLRAWCKDDESVVKVHKSIPNRLIEPWMWITVVMTATEWNNFFRLRCHPDAEIHFQKIAGMARDAIRESDPLEENAGSWHLPYVTGAPDQVELCRAVETSNYTIEDSRMVNMKLEALVRVSVARCSRVSYEKQGKLSELQEDFDQFERLYKGSGFGHWSPMEHPAVALHGGDYWRTGPFVGWRQYRKFFPQECA